MLCAPGAQLREFPQPLDSIRAAFWQIYEFSKSHPEHFALMFLDRTVPQISKNWQRFEFVREMKVLIGAEIQRAIDAGDFPAATQSHAVFQVLITAIMGASIAQLCHRIGPQEDPDALAHDTLEAALTGLRQGFAGKLRTPPDPEPSREQ